MFHFKNLFYKLKTLGMTEKQIKKIIESYNDLISLTKTKIKVLEKIDSTYYTFKGIKEIHFDEKEVFVVCDNSYRGCTGTEAFDFPLTWLSKLDYELINTVLLEKDLRIAEEIKIAEMKKAIEKKETDQKEYEQFCKLKAKFEQKQII